MIMHNVLVTGVGAVIGYGIVRSLRAMDQAVNIIGMDIYPDAAGQRWCNHFERATPAAAADYPDFIRSLVQKHSIDLVIPGIEQDVTRMVDDRSAWLDLKARFVLNNPTLVAICADKWLTACSLIEAGLPVIKTSITGNYSELSQELGVPFLLKPRRSYASKGIQKIQTEADLEYWRNKLGNNFMVQEIVGDDETEYTVAAFGFGNGYCGQKLILQRKLSGEGATAKARVVSLPALDNMVDDLAKHFKPIGPTNFQFRYHAGGFLLLEINPRFSSSTSLRAAFGYNEAEMSIEYYLAGRQPATRSIRTGRAVRYIEDIVTYDSDPV
jgi:carbamoyl-phosphate synthase large subunit